MNYTSTWTRKTIGLALTVMMGVALLTAMGTTDQSTGFAGFSASAACMANDNQGSDPAGPNAVSAIDQDQDHPCQDEEFLQPVAVCRLRPECSTNEECDVVCGAGLGKCVHSNCPVRICRCR